MSSPAEVLEVLPELSPAAQSVSQLLNITLLVALVWLIQWIRSDRG